MSDESKPVGESTGLGPAEPAVERRARPCPICGKLALKGFHPFCSKRCADVDLNRWLSGRYVIPGSPLTDEDGDRLSDGEDER